MNYIEGKGLSNEVPWDVLIVLLQQICNWNSSGDRTEVKVVLANIRSVLMKLALVGLTLKHK